MSEAAAPRLARLATWLAGVWEMWNRFWFQPANPTTVGVMRLCAGLLTFYVHFAYSWDLQDFFGKDAWLSLKTAQELRRDSPWLPPSTNWLGHVPNLFLPAHPGQRDDLLAFLEQLPDDPVQRRIVIESIWHPDRAPASLYLPTYVRTLPDDPPAGFVPASEREIPRQATKWQLTRFIAGLPHEKEERLSIIRYIRRWGLDPRELGRRGGTYFSIWYHVTEPTAMVITHSANLVVMFLFAIGFCTRITGVLTWLAAVGYLHRSTITLFGGDTMMNILLFYLMLAPSGAAVSADRLIARWWSVRQARRAGRPIPEPAPPEPSVSANFFLRCLQIHFCIIYLAAGTSKLLGGMWWNGNAIYYTMANYEFAPLRFHYYLEFLRWVCGDRWRWEIIMHGGTFYTLILEIAFPFLVWNRLFRPFCVAASMLLHLFIATFMGLIIFSLLMATLVMSFIPGEIMESLLQRVRQLTRKASEPREQPPPAPAASEAGSSGESQPSAVPQQTASPVTDIPAGGRRKNGKKGKDSVAG